MWAHFEKLLSNLKGYDFDLYVTMVRPNQEVAENVKRSFPNVKILITPNKGYDIGPFFAFLNEIDLDKYDLILKLQTKSVTKGVDTKINHFFISRQDWAHLLTSGLIGNKRIVKRNLSAFQNEADLGMIGSRFLILRNEKNQFLTTLISNALKKCGYVSQNQQLAFVAGTMFFVRSKLLKTLKNNFNIDSFDETNSIKKDGTLAHAMERVFGYCVIFQGYKIKGFDFNFVFIIKQLLKELKRFVYYKKITSNNKVILKIFKIPVYHSKIK